MAILPIANITYELSSFSGRRRQVLLPGRPLHRRGHHREALQDAEAHDRLLRLLRRLLLVLDLDRRDQEEQGLGLGGRGGGRGEEAEEEGAESHQGRWGAGEDGRR